MSRFPDSTSFVSILFLLLTASFCWAAEPSKPVAYYGYGKAATPAQIAGWNIDVRPDGEGLPPGSGSVEDGEYIYEAQCAQCHGSFGEGQGRYPSLAGGEGSLRQERPHKSVASYWKYTSTLWDYIHRAMPFTQPESLSDDEVYAVTAYVLYLNDLVEDDFVLSQQNLASIRLPNEANFVPDPRPDVHNKRCMKNCRDAAAIAIKSEAPLYVPAERALASQKTLTDMGSAVYSKSCALCHDSGVAGAPITGDKGAWTARITSGVETLYSHAINGYQGEVGTMPAKGGFMQLSDEEVKSAVDYIVEGSL